MTGRAFIEHYRAYADQQVGCGCVIAKGETVITVRFGDDITAGAITMCPACLDAIGRAVTGVR